MTIPRTLAALITALIAMMFGHQAQAATPARGYLDSVIALNGEVSAAGWSVDPAHTGWSTSVRVTVDGRTLTRQATNTTRTDVDRALRITGTHGYRIAFTVPTGNHQVCLDGLTAAGSPTPLGCVGVTVLPLATDAQMRAQVALIDPRHTVAWGWFTAAPTGELGQALPWSNAVHLSTMIPAVNLRSVMLHEWAHVLQYRAAGGDWWKAVGSADVAAGRPYSTSYYGLEHEADCMAQQMGATWLAYGCTQTLNTAARAAITAGRN